jgi:hypothetical protein
MMFLLRMLRRGRGPAMDPLQVSMTGVRMGERFLQIGCHDRSLLSGLAAKVGLSGTAAVAAFNDEQARRAASIGAKVGALIEVQNIEEGRPWPFGDGQFDMVVVDDTVGGFGDLDQSAANPAERALQPSTGGRIEVVARPQVRCAELQPSSGAQPRRASSRARACREGRAADSSRGFAEITINK